MKLLHPWKFLRHAKEIYNFVKQGDYHETDEGLIVHDAICIRGHYHLPDEVLPQKNLLTTESINNILDVVYGTTTWYVSLYSGNATPIAGWTAANYVANATENTSQTEGYSGVNRIEFNDSAAAAGVKSNLANRAEFSIVTASSVTFYGAALHTIQTRGATTGVLGSAIRFASARTRENGDTFTLGYSLSITDS